jgi:transcriptional regulator with XRE-family HTH domain
MARTKAEPDFLDEMVEESIAANPAFSGMLAEAVARREALRTLADERKALDLTQTAAAAAMGTSQSAIGKLETSASDALISTVQRYAKALGMKLQMVLVPEDSDEPAVIVKRDQRPKSKRAARAVPASRARYSTAKASAKSSRTTKSTSASSARSVKGGSATSGRAVKATAKAGRKTTAKSAGSKRSRTAA